IGKSHLLKMEGLVKEPDPREGCKIIVHIEVGNSDSPFIEGEQPMDVRVIDPPGDSCAPAELAPDVGEDIPGQGAEGPEGKVREIGHQVQFLSIVEIGQISVEAQNFTIVLDQPGAHPEFGKVVVPENTDLKIPQLHVVHTEIRDIEA